MLNISNILLFSLIAYLLGGLIELKAQELDSEQLLGAWGVDAEVMQPIWEADLQKLLDAETDLEIRELIEKNYREITASIAGRYFIFEKEGILIFGQKDIEQQERGTWRIEGDRLLMMLNLDAAEMPTKIIAFEAQKRLVLQIDTENPENLVYFIPITIE